MKAEAEVVRRLIHWSLVVVLMDEAVRSGKPGPRMPTSPLGHLMNRHDPDTARSIVEDMDHIDPMLRHETVMGLLSPVTESRRGSSRSQGVEDAQRLVDRLHAWFQREDRRLLEQGSLMTFKSLETHWPGRAWQSLRDDYEILAEKFFLLEKIFLYSLANKGYKFDKVGGLRK